MVQVLPYVQSPLEQLTPYIGQAAQGLGFGIGNAIKNKKDQALINQLQGNASGVPSENGNAPSAPDIYTIWSQLSPEKRKTYEPFLQSQLRVQEAQGKENIKRETEELEKKATREELAPTAKRLEEINETLGSQPGNLELSEELTRLGFWFTDKIYTHFNKGVISNVKFSELKNVLSPNAKEPPRVNRARIKALSTIANLPSDISPKEFNKIADKEIKKVRVEEKNPSKKPSLDEFWQ